MFLLYVYANFSIYLLIAGAGYFKLEKDWVKPSFEQNSQVLNQSNSLPTQSISQDSSVKPLDPPTIVVIPEIAQMVQTPVRATVQERAQLRRNMKDIIMNNKSIIETDLLKDAV